MLAFFMTVCIFSVFIFFDVVQLQELQNKKDNYNSNDNGQEETDIENAVHIENIYTEISKQFINSNRIQEGINKMQNQEAANLTHASINAKETWRIVIPKLKLNAPIIEGTSQKVLGKAVGHFEETDKWKGNVALAGHNRGYRCNFFQEIKNLSNGDIIIYSTEKGTRQYQVILNVLIKETDWSYIENTEDNRITLITCEANKREYRRCIQGIEIKNDNLTKREERKYENNEKVNDDTNDNNTIIFGKWSFS